MEAVLATSLRIFTSRVAAMIVLALVVAFLTPGLDAQSHWGLTHLDADSTTMFAGSLAMDGQPYWFYYNGADAPGGAYMGWLYQAQSLSGTIQLPRALTPGRYYVFFNGLSYDYNMTLRVSGGGATSTSVVADDRDDNRLWTTRAVFDVTSTTSALQLTMYRNPNNSADQKYLFMGLYITTADETVDRYSTAIKLVYPTVMSAASAVKGNLLTDGGFESGVTAQFGYDGKRTVPPAWDTTTAWEGKASLRIPLDHSFNNWGDNTGIYSRVFHLKPNTKYTASMYVKTNPGRTEALLLNFENAFTPPPGYQVQPDASSGIIATDQWQRISVSGYALDYPSPDYQIFVFANENPGADLWIDGFQLEEGDLSPYQPSSAVTAGVVISGQPGNIYYSDESVTGTLVVRNQTDAAASALVRYEIYDALNKMVQQGSQNFSLPGQTTQQQVLNIGGRTGIFRVVSWVEGMEHTDKEVVYTVMPRPATNGSDPGSYLGMALEFTDAQLATQQKLGMKWARAHSPSGYFLWQYSEPQPGVYNFYDAVMQKGVAYGVSTMGTLGTNSFWPPWAEVMVNGRPLPDLDKWQSYVAAMAGHYKGLVTHWEIWNEPNSVFTPDFYGQMLKRAVDAIEANAPGSKAVGMGGVPLSYMNAVIAALNARYPTWNWAQHISIVATHAYPDGEPPENFTVPIIGTYGTQVWNTEAGSWDRGFYQGPDSGFTAPGKALWQYLDASRYYIGAAGSPNQILQNFLRTVSSGSTKYFYYDARSYNSPEYIRAHTSTIEYDGTVRPKGVVYAIAGTLVDHATGMGNAASDPNSMFLMYDKSSGPIAALFSTDKKPKQVSLATLSSSQIQVLDWMANPISVPGTTIPYGRYPVYIRGIGISATALKTALAAGIVSGRNDTTPPNVSISDGPRGPVKSGTSFRMRFIGLDDTSYPSNGETNPGASAQSEPPNPEALQYSYQLQGYSGWSAWESKPYADFSNVPDGAYTFSVKIRDEAGNESAVASRSVNVGNVSVSSPQLNISLSHAGNFTQGQVGASYTIGISNNGSGPTSGTVTVSDTVPTGLTITGMSGTGWSCSSSCQRSDGLAAGGSYPAITVTVNVDSSAASSLTNSASVSGGGSASSSANDVTTVTPTISGGTGRTNYALPINGATAVASSSYNANYSAAGAIDGDRAGVNWGADGGWNDATVNSFPDWLEVDFSGAKTLNEIDVFTVQDSYWSPADPTASMTFTTWGVRDFQVQYWTGTGWQDIPGGNVVANSLVWRQFMLGAPLTTSKIRVYVNSALNGYSRITELEAWGGGSATPIRSNVALAANGGVTVASSSASSKFPASAANDGDRKGANWGNGGGWNDMTYKLFPDWLEIDFSGTKTLDEIDIFGLQDDYAHAVDPTPGMTFTQYGLRDFQVQFWNGSAWQDVPGGNVTANSLVWRQFLLGSPITTSKIRVYVNNAFAGYSRIIEVEAWGN